MLKQFLSGFYFSFISHVRTFEINYFISVYFSFISCYVSRFTCPQISRLKQIISRLLTAIFKSEVVNGVFRHGVGLHDFNVSY